jgi:mersacidin/lichenicidin family type 2 lantibiotic
MRIEKEKIMSNNKIVRAWKDPVYRNSLSEAERAALPANPAGSIEISDADLGKVSGGLSIFSLYCTQWCNTVFCPSKGCPVTVAGTCRT